MPIRFNVKTGGVVELLGRLVDDAAIRAGMKEGAEAFAQELKSSYPDEANSHRPQAQFWDEDDKTRRGFFYHLNHGDITVPYRRTNFLAESWKVKPKGTNFLVTNSAPKASLVQGKRRTVYHKITGWKNPREIWSAVAAKIGRRIAAVMLSKWRAK